MKFKTLSLFAILGIAFYTFTLSSSTGPTAVANQGDCTGSPLSAISCNNSGCHDYPTIATNVDPFRPYYVPRNLYMAIQNNYIKALDSGWDALKEYQPGHTYVLNLTPDVQEVTDPQGNTKIPFFGLQATALLDDTTQAGTFSILDTSFQITNYNGIDYLEHKAVLSGIYNPNGSLFNLTTLYNYYPGKVYWTAPPVNSGDVTIYCAALASDGNMARDGDSVQTDTIIIHEKITATTQIKTIPQVQTYPNPTVDVVNISFGAAADYTIRTTNLSGKTLQNKTFTNATRATINLADYPKGTYILYINDGERTSTQKVMKQ